jgi:hypothetical protein
VRDLAESIDDFDLIDAVDAGREPAVHAEDLVVDHDRQRQVVEHVGEVVPHVSVAVLPATFSIKSVRLRDSARLVVAADQVDAMRVAELEAYKEGYCLDAKETSVDIVSYGYMD